MVRQLRVKAFSVNQPAGRGYVGRERVHYQLLQEGRWWGWRTLDGEIVPIDVKIALAATGYDSSNWESKFYKIGTFGRDGIFTDFHK